MPHCMSCARLLIKALEKCAHHGSPPHRLLTLQNIPIDVITNVQNLGRVLDAQHLVQVPHGAPLENFLCASTARHNQPSMQQRIHKQHVTSRQACNIEPMTTNDRECITVCLMQPYIATEANPAPEPLLLTVSARYVSKPITWLKETLSFKAVH
jgi:hypothetical protein